MTDLTDDIESVRESAARSAAARINNFLYSWQEDDMSTPSKPDGNIPSWCDPESVAETEPQPLTLEALSEAIDSCCDHPLPPRLRLVSREEYEQYLRAERTQRAEQPPV